MKQSQWHLTRSSGPDQSLSTVGQVLAVPAILLVVALVGTAVFHSLKWIGIDNLEKRVDFTIKTTAGLAAAFGLFVAWRRSEAALTQAQTAEQGQITDRFTKAIDQLGQHGDEKLGQHGDEKLAIRLGGIYALERIALDSDRDRGAVMEVLCAYVRNWKPCDFDPLAKASECSEPQVKLPTDVQAILTVLARRQHGRELGDQRIDLSGANFRNADLRGANFINADLFGAHLHGADLLGANLNGAHLYGADLLGATLNDADLSSADLRYAENLVQVQINEARGNAETKLPPHLDPPGTWSADDD